MKLFNKVWQVGLLAAIVSSGGLIAYSQVDPPSYGKSGSLMGLLSKADALQQNVREDLRHVSHVQDQARKFKDIIKLTCVNDKFVAIKAEANVFDENVRNLRSLVPEAGGQQELYEQCVVAAGAVHDSRVQADGCLGEVALTGEAANSFTHPAFPDPTLGDPFGTGVEPPAYASPFN